MAEVVLTDARFGSSARILPTVGFNCYSLQVPVDGHLIEVLDSDPQFASGDKRGTRSGIPWLFPFPNRIATGHFQWNGKSYQLPVSDAFGNAIHGFVMDRPWRVTECRSDEVTAVFQLGLDAPDRLALWPSDFLLEVRYRLREGCLRADIRIVNVGDAPLPWGLGTHPYFRTPLVAGSKQGQCLVDVPADEYWELIDCLPTGQRLPVDDRTDLRNGAEIEGRSLDDVLTGLTPQNGTITTSVMDPAGGVQMTQITDSVFCECVVFTPPGRPCVCIEPYTCVTNAINLSQQGLETGWRELPVGDEFRTWWEIHVSPILA